MPAFDRVWSPGVIPHHQLRLNELLITPEQTSQFERHEHEAPWLYPRRGPPSSTSSEEVQAEVQRQLRSFVERHDGEARRLPEEVQNLQEERGRLTMQPRQQAQGDRTVEDRQVPGDWTVEGRQVQGDWTTEGRQVPRDRATEGRQVPRDRSTEGRQVPRDRSTEGRQVPRDRSTEGHDQPERDGLPVGNQSQGRATEYFDLLAGAVLFVINSVSFERLTIHGTVWRMVIRRVRDLRQWNY